MKKHYLAAAVLTLALGMTACSSQKPAETTAAQTTAAETAIAETTAAQTTAEAEEEEYFYGYVKEIKDKIVTIEDDEGTAAKFDFSNAEFTDDKKLGVGDEVEITYTGELSADVNKAVMIEIVTSAAEESAEAAAAEEDQTVSGTIEKADGGSVTLKCDDGTYVFDTAIAQKVSKGGIKAGVAADITYYGDLDDKDAPPMATRIVTEDARDSKDAKILALTGKVVEVSPGSVVLETADKDKSLFAFVGDENMFKGLKEGDTATVSYEGTLTARVIVATGLLK